ncbi:MAG: class II aldolase/adducin family protein, partial [Verrucomicrobiota bacterium]
MSTVLTAKDIEEIIARGGDPAAAAQGALLTPSARDVLRDHAGRTGRPGPAPAVATAAAVPARPLNSRSPKAELEAYFNSPAAHALKEQLCDIGRRLWQRAYVDGNGGNMAIRVGEDIAICTPTLVSKGSLKPEDMCLVDFEG